MIRFAKTNQALAPLIGLAPRRHEGARIAARTTIERANPCL
jgi:transposase